MEQFGQVREESVRQEIHFVEPDIVRLLFVIAVHLEGNVDLFLGPVGLGAEVGIDVVSLIRNGEGDVVHLIANTLEMPGQVDPSLRWEMIAWNRNWNPNSVQGVPYIPVVGLIEVALRAPRPTSIAEGLIHVEL
jgi:hypothetical protein